MFKKIMLSFILLVFFNCIVFPTHALSIDSVQINLTPGRKAYDAINIPFPMPTTVVINLKKGHTSLIFPIDDKSSESKVAKSFKK